MLSYFSVIHYKLDDVEEPGWVKSNSIGDSTTGKSKTAIFMIDWLDAGLMVVGENATIPGLIGAAINTSHGWTIEFGVLVIQDMKLVFIDGAHSMPPEMWGKIAEIERTGNVTLEKAAKGRGNARTRLNKIQNPSGEDHKSTRTMKSFLYPALTLQNNFQSQSIARMDIVAFVSNDDVKQKEINIEMKEKPDDIFHCFSDLLKVVWAQKFKIIVEDDAMSEILKCSIDLHNKFSNDDIPLISNDMKYKLIRMCISVAAICCSFDEKYEKLIVKKEHVEFLVRFIDIEYSKAGLDKMNDFDEKIDVLEAEEVLRSVLDSLHGINRNIDVEECKKILVWIAKKSIFTKNELMGMFNLPDTNGIRPLISELLLKGIITMTMGFSPTKKALQVAKLIQNMDFSNNKDSPQTTF